MRIALTALIAVGLFASTAPLGAAPCKDASGKFVKCPKEAAAPKQYKNGIVLAAGVDSNKSSRSTSTPPKVSNGTNSQGGGPTANEIAAYHARLAVRDGGGRLTTVPGQQIASSALLGDVFTIDRSVSNLHCISTKRATFSCSYDMNVHVTADETKPFVSMIIPAVEAGNRRGTSRLNYEYVKKGGFWTSTALDAESAQHAAETRAAAAARQSDPPKNITIGCAAGIYEFCN